MASCKVVLRRVVRAVCGRVQAAARSLVRTVAKALGVCESPVVDRFEPESTFEPEVASVQLVSEHTAESVLPSTDMPVVTPLERADDRPLASTATVIPASAPAVSDRLSTSGEPLSTTGEVPALAVATVRTAITQISEETSARRPRRPRKVSKVSSSGKATDRHPYVTRFGRSVKTRVVLDYSDL